MQHQKRQTECPFLFKFRPKSCDGGRAVLCPLFPQDRHSDFHQHSTPVHPALVNPHPQCEGSQVGNFVVTSTTRSGRLQALYPGCSEVTKRKRCCGCFLAPTTPTSCSMTKLLIKPECGYFFI